MRFFLSLLLGLSLVPSTAMADTRPAVRARDVWTRPEPEPKDTGHAFKDRPLVVSGRLGFGAPLGLMGLGVDYSLHSQLALTGGFGIGDSLDGLAPRLALGTHLRPVLGVRNAMVVDMHYSGGPYRRLNLGLSHSGEHIEQGMAYAHFAQAGLGWERQSEGGFSIRTVGGIAGLLNPGDMTCRVVYSEYADTCAPHTSSEILPYFEVSLGYAL